MRPSALVAVLLVATSVSRTAPLTAQWPTPVLEDARQELPADLPEWLSPLLESGGYAVSDDNGALLTFWFRSELPQQEPSSEFGVDFQKFPPGGLIGLVHFSQDWGDYRKRTVAKGTYTMRYGVQPADGDHTGQTYFRDFLMLLPIAGDEFPPEGADDAEELVEVSKLATGTEHPGVIAMYQIYEPVDGPTIVMNDFSEPCLALPLPELVMGLVLFGHGTELPV